MSFQPLALGAGVIGILVVLWKESRRVVGRHRGEIVAAVETDSNIDNVAVRVVLGTGVFTVPLCFSSRSKHRGVLHNSGQRRGCDHGTLLADSVVLRSHSSELRFHCLGSAPVSIAQ